MNKGFYEELESLKEDYEDSDFGFLENEIIVDNIHAFSFLHGFCDIFAYKLNELFSYELECIMNEDGLIHAYCKKNINGKTFFIDVRGITDDYEKFIEEFGDFISYLDVPSYPVEGTEKMKELSKISNTSDFLKYSEAAEKLILDYKEYYTI